MQKSDKIFITNHEKMPGRSFVRRLKERGFENLILKTKSELNLLDQSAVSGFFLKEKPNYVILTSIRSGGIQANVKHAAEFLYENLAVQNNVINAAKQSGVKKLIFLAASCAYPKDSPQPIKEECLLKGPVEKTSEAYSIAKICGIKMCEYYNKKYKTKFISVIPATIFGPDDDFDVETSHVIPALVRRIHTAKIEKNPSVTIWGTGLARREFIYADEIADACIFVMQKKDSPDLINIGTGFDISIGELAKFIQETVGFAGRLEFDATKPEGAKQKLLDITLLSSLGWEPKTDIKVAIKQIYQQYLKNNTQGALKTRT